MSRIDTSPAAFILAGGRGTRLSSILGNYPKPLAQAAGRPFLEYLILWLRAQNISQIVFLTDQYNNLIEKYFSDGGPWQISIQYVYEDCELGTGGAVVNALKLLNWQTPFYLFNGDSFIDMRISAFYRKVKGGEAGIVLTSCPDCGPYGWVEIDDDEWIVYFNEKGHGSAGLINGGIYYLSPTLFAKCTPGRKYSLEHDIIPQWVKKGVAIKGFVCNGFFLDIGTPVNYRRFQSYMDNKSNLFED